MGDTWDPQQYDRFAGERRRPFDDLLTLLQPVPGGQVVDLGCGTGGLTAELHRHLGAADTLGIDSSTAMLERAVAEPGLRFEVGDIATWKPDQPLAVVFANASLQWVPDHGALLGRLHDSLADGGQLAVHVPSNFDHPSHVVANTLGLELGLPPIHRFASVLPLETYASVLHALGFREQLARLQVYGAALDTTADIVEWTKGTLLTEFRAVLDPDAYDAFVREYRTRLLEALGDPDGTRPYFYPFKRILLWARR